MKICLVVLSVLLLQRSSEATFGGHGGGGGSLALSGNFHGLLSHPLLSKKASPAVVVTEAPVSIPIEPAPAPAPALASGHGFSLHGNIHGLLKNHKLFNIFHKKQTTAAPAAADFGFEGDSTGFVESTGNAEVSAPQIVEYVAPEPVFNEEIPSNNIAEVNTISEVSEVPQQPTSGASSSSASGSFSLSGGHNVHKILGDVVGLKVKLLQQVQNQISGRFDNHIKNLDKLAEKFNKKSESSGGSLHGGFSLHGNRY